MHPQRNRRNQHAHPHSPGPVVGEAYPPQYNSQFHPNGPQYTYPVLPAPAAVQTSNFIHYTGPSQVQSTAAVTADYEDQTKYKPDATIFICNEQPPAASAVTNDQLSHPFNMVTMNTDMYSQTSYMRDEKEHYQSLSPQPHTYLPSPPAQSASPSSTGADSPMTIDPKATTASRNINRDPKRKAIEDKAASKRKSAVGRLAKVISNRLDALPQNGLANQATQAASIIEADAKRIRQLENDLLVKDRKIRALEAKVQKLEEQQQLGP